MASESFNAEDAPDLDAFAIEASEKPEFQQIVAEAPSPLEAIRGIRELLGKEFPQIENVPNTSRGWYGTTDLEVAKKIYELLK